jgi:hypothetical protein
MAEKGTHNNSVRRDTSPLLGYLFTLTTRTFEITAAILMTNILLI